MKKSALLLPYAFVAMNWAAVIGLYWYLKRRKGTEKELWNRPSHGKHLEQRRNTVKDRALWSAAEQNEV